MVVEDCLFCGIVAGDVDADVVHATERTVAFRDLNPQAPTHVLVVPRDHFANAAELAAGDPDGLRRAGRHGGRGRHGRGPRRLPARLQHRRRRRAERLPHPPAPARRAPDDLAARVTRPTSRVLLAAAAAALVVPFAASCMDSGDEGHRAGDPGALLQPTQPPEVEAQQLAATPKGKLLPLRDGEQRMTLDHARDLHAVGADGTGTDDYRCFLLDPHVDQDVWLTGSNVLPGNPDVVHHVILFKLTPETVRTPRPRTPRPPTRAGPASAAPASPASSATSTTPTGSRPGRPAATRPRSRTATASSSRRAPGS